MPGEAAPDRTVIAITGADRRHFLQGLVSNDVTDLSGRLVYAALLTPQGKYLADFFLTEQGETILLDIKSELAPGLMQRLTMYKLRADVALKETGLHVQRGLGPAPEGALADPRHPDMGWRAYTEAPGTAPEIDWDARRVANCIPETGVELIPNETFLLEAGFERLNGVDFHKGCYVGQEVTARMKHKTELKKGLATVLIAGDAPVGSEITADGKPAGTLFTRADGQAIAYLRFDRAAGPMQAGDATVTRRG
ncbi:folate-binding protein YgfZ [Rhodovulum iodosum]|uniref:Folate-binding protein YgfZ n=1 Tax=Rhodovulum iodosum TaxID=68291 RepID=A0ABV3XPY1_9RHOB|nr:folate-binding protein YgfZ [Rhodovulum robiginosum]RSK31593.1 folate-binding protein [Rhodovulum robiginosum]